ncbi:MAG: hypothetical protein FJ265_16785, partial [Planctomycetes bacterium]|nr:hypothetical protein [Planctomycetota bacterium]
MPASARRLHFLSCFLVCQLAAAFAAAQDVAALAGVLEARVPQLMAANHVPGLSMVLIQDNAIVWQKAFGVRVAGQPEPVDANTVFEAASMSKPVYSYAALQLVEQGKLDLDKPLDSYLPAPYLPDQPLAARITARLVLLHRTGLPNWREGGWLRGGPPALLHEPGSRFTYSGEGYTYLQTAVAALTGKPVETWMDEVLLGPLQMTRSSYVWKPALADNFAGGHDKDGKPKPKRGFYDRANAAFSLYTTPADYARFLIEVMRPGRAAPHSVSAAAVAQMTTLQVEPEADKAQSRRSLGFVVAAPEHGGWVGHSGSNGTGFRCTSRFDPSRRSGCVVMTNADSGAEVWQAVLAIVDSLPAQTSRPEAPAGRTWGDVERTVQYEYRVTNGKAGPSGRFDVFVPLPLATKRQQIHYLRLSERGRQREFTDVHGQRLVHYSFADLAPGEQIDVGFVAGVTLRNMRWDVAGAADPQAVLGPEQRARYLRAESNYSMDSELMRRTAAELVAGATSDLDKLARIHDHIITKIRYVRDNTWDPAATVLARGTGSCSEYNYVLSGLCRLAGLPTRAVGGSIGGFRALPATDTVFHRWTEVFLQGQGWFPADCSRDANPIRGKRSHFGRVYTDALTWCCQAGGELDTLGWEYRAKLRPAGDESGLHQEHRTRWFALQREQELAAAETWLGAGRGPAPAPDLLECALLRWGEAGPDDRLRAIRALAAAQRPEALRRAAALPEAQDCRAGTVRGLCANQELADTVLAKSRSPAQFRTWFRDHEGDLVAAPGGRFELRRKAPRRAVPATSAGSAQIWAELAAEVVDRLPGSAPIGKGKSAVVVPVTDQTLAGLGPSGPSIHADLKHRAAGELHLALLDEAAFDRAMAEHGPGSGEFWALANGDVGRMPKPLIPDFVLVPVCVTEPAGNDETVRYRLDLRVLELAGCDSRSVTAERRRQPADGERPPARSVLIAGGDTVLARWQHDAVGRRGYDWPLAALAPVLSAADAALCNLECCVSLRGEPADKGERCPFYYRARPEMLRCLMAAGIDVVTAANNHGGDYGPLAAHDTARWCAEAGLVCVGIGANAAVAGALQFVRVGGVRVAVAGLDTTMPRTAAAADRAGTPQ